MDLSPELMSRLRRWRLAGLACALAGGFVCAFGWITYPDRFHAAWLTAFLYWLGMSLGCLIMAFVHGLTGGAWGRATRRVLEAGYQTLPLMALLFVPLWLGVGRIYEWADPEFVRQHAVLVRKAGYLNVDGFQLRAVVYFAVWLIAARVVDWSSPNDEPALETERSRRLQRHSGLCCIAICYAMTFASVDWMMSLEPEWYSTMYAVLQIAGQAVAGLSFAVIVVSALREFEPWRRGVTPDRLHDLGNLLLAAVMFWTYCTFFQFLVVWQGNLPEENVWFVHRSRQGWQFLAAALVALHFALPFLLLLSRQNKRQATHLARIAALLVVMRYVDLYWQIVPGFQNRPGVQTGDSFSSSLLFCWLDLAALAGMGGLWLALFAWRLSVRAAVPMYDPIPVHHHPVHDQQGDAVDGRSSHTAIA